MVLNKRVVKGADAHVDFGYVAAMSNGRVDLHQAVRHQALAGILGQLSSLLSYAHEILYRPSPGALQRRPAPLGPRRPRPSRLRLPSPPRAIRPVHVPPPRQSPTTERKGQEDKGQLTLLLC